MYKKKYKSTDKCQYRDNTSTETNTNTETNTEIQKQIQMYLVYQRGFNCLALLKEGSSKRSDK